MKPKLPFSARFSRFFTNFFAKIFGGMSGKLRTKLSEGDIFKVIKNSGYFFGTSIVGLGVSFISFPLYAILMTKEDFGIVAFFTSVGTVATQFSILSLTNYYIVKSRSLDKAESQTLFRNIVIFNFFWNLGLTVIGMVALHLYLIIAGSEMSVFPNGLIIFTILITQSFITFKTVQFRIEGEGRNYFFTGISQVIGNAIFSVGLIWAFSLGATGKLAGIAISNFLIALFLGRSLIWGDGEKLSIASVKAGIREMLPLTLVSFLHSTAPAADVLVLERYNDFRGLGVYNVGKQIGNFVTLAGTSLFQAFEPGFYEDAKKRSLFRSARFYLFVLMLGLLVGLYFIFSDLIITILTAGRFHESLQYSNIFVLQALFLPVIQALQVPLYLAGKVKIIAGINLVGSLITFGLIFALTAEILYTGAALAFLISSGLQFLMIAIAERKYGKS